MPQDGPASQTNGGHRQFVPIRSLPQDVIPTTPVFDGEDKLDVPRIAQDFLTRFGRAATDGNWDAWKGLWTEDGWWKDNLTLTYDKRTLRGASTIARAWSTLSKERKPAGWSLDTKKTTGIDMGPSAWMRMAPVMASLDFNFSFTLDNPKSACIGVIKLLPQPLDGGKVDWKVWVLTTWMVSLSDHPFRPLPLSSRDTPSLVPENQRGQPSAQGLPQLAPDAVFDAVVVGFSSCGMANTIQLESIGLNTIAFDFEPTAGGFWAKTRYEGVQLHHSKRMIQLPINPPDEEYQKFMTGKELGEYYSDTVRKLQLPMFAGIRVTSNTWDEGASLWTSEIEDVRTGNKAKVRSKNLVLSNGFLLGGFNRLQLPGEDKFKGTVQHSAEVTTSQPYAGKDVLVVGSGNSAHDIAGQIVRSGVAKSVSLLQRSPSVLMEFEQLFSMFFARYEGPLPVDAADILHNAMPTAILHMMAKGLFQKLSADAEEMNKKFESFGYLVDRDADIMEKALEERGRSFYLDQPGTFDLVFSRKLLIKRGEAKGFTPDGVITKYQDEQEQVVKADAVILATGYKNYDLPKEWAKSGFLDRESAGKVENLGRWGVDKEGEFIGHVTESGHPNLYFAAIGLIHARFIGNAVAIQIMTDKTGTTPARYPRD